MAVSSVDDPAGFTRRLRRGMLSGRRAVLSVRYDTHHQVAVITIDRPERRNAVDRATANALFDAWRRFDADDSVRVGVLYGAGGTFSAGADLVAFDLEDRPEGFLGFTRMEVSKPTIAAVEGYCVAGGLEMALWCDLRVAGLSAVFGCFERRFGVPLVDGGTQRLPRIVGRGIAMEMVLTGRPVDAEEAYTIGLANLVVEDGRALEAAVRMARSIAGFPQETLRADRRALIEGSDLPIEDGLQVERRYGTRVMDHARQGAVRFAAGGGRGGRPLDEPGGSIPTGLVPVLASDLELEVDGVPVRTMVASPRRGEGPGVILLHDRWGLDPEAVAFLRRLAETGFVAVGVELFPPPAAPEPGDDRALAPDRVTAVLRRAVATVKSIPATRGRLGVVGFGIGGGLAMWLAGAEPSVRGCVAFTPTSPWPNLAPDFGTTRAAFLGHYGAFDDQASPHTAYQLELKLREAGVDATFETYRRVGSEFYRMSDDHDPEVAALAWSRTVAFLRRVL